MIGTSAGTFKILQEIGEGGMGKVYRGVDTMLDREVAIKVLRPELVSHAHLVDRFRSEAITLAKLNHPNIAMLYAFFQQEQHFFMVLEFVKGETLDRRIRRSGMLAYDQALRHFLMTLEAIGYAHSMGVVHRDIKPSNVMITTADEVKVMDFGIARVVGSERMTREGSMIGTPEYMAPEQIRGQEVEPRTDIYALGILLYEMLTGRLPFMSQNQFELMRAHIEQPPPAPRAFAPHIPESMEQVMLRALAKRKEDRFGSAYEFRDAILSLPDLPNLGLNAGTAGARSTPISNPSFARPSFSGVSTPPHSTPPSPASPGAGVSVERRTVDSRQFEAQQQQQRTGTSTARSGVSQAPRTDAGATQVAPAGTLSGQVGQSAVAEIAPAPNRKPLLLGGLALAAVLGAGVYWMTTGKSPTPGKQPGGTTTPTKVVKVFKPDLVEFTGGRFQIGRADAPREGGEEELEWGYAQWPAAPVTVPPFALDRYEVSNEEYAQFVAAKNYPAPSDWNGKEPFVGQEKWPVRNVSYHDALAFAAWRSERDGVKYDLPTEEQWEFAARNGGDATVKVFPWGSDWDQSRANLNGTSQLKPVDAYPEGKTTQGVFNLIGNVGEWTKSPAGYYEGNTVMELPPALKTAYVVRGGSYIGKLDGAQPVRVTIRAFYQPEKKDPTIGFRLARVL